MFFMASVRGDWRLQLAEWPGTYHLAGSGCQRSRKVATAWKAAELNIKRTSSC